MVFAINFSGKIQKQEIKLKLKHTSPTPPPPHPLQVFMGTKGSWTDFLLSKSSRLKASSLVAEHLVGAVGSAEKRVGEEKQSLKSPV